MWRAAAGNNVQTAVSDEDDDWATDADFEVSNLKANSSINISKVFAEMRHFIYITTCT